MSGRRIADRLVTVHTDPPAGGPAAVEDGRRTHREDVMSADPAKVGPAGAEGGYGESLFEPWKPGEGERIDLAGHLGALP